MYKAGLDTTCSTKDEWLDMLDKYICSHDARELAGVAGKRAAENHYTEDETMSRWDKVLASIL